MSLPWGLQELKPSPGTANLAGSALDWAEAENTPTPSFEALPQVLKGCSYTTPTEHKDQTLKGTKAGSPVATAPAIGYILQ